MPGVFELIRYLVQQTRDRICSVLHRLAWAVSPFAHCAASELAVLNERTLSLLSRPVHCFDGVFERRDYRLLKPATTSQFEYSTKTIKQAVTRVAELARVARLAPKSRREQQVIRPKQVGVEQILYLTPPVLHCPQKTFVSNQVDNWKHLYLSFFPVGYSVIHL